MRTNAPVAEVLTAQGRASGVRLASGEVIPADIVICNGEFPRRLPPGVSVRGRRARCAAASPRQTLAFGAGVVCPYAHAGFRPVAS